MGLCAALWARMYYQSFPFSPMCVNLCCVEGKGKEGIQVYRKPINKKAL